MPFPLTNGSFWLKLLLDLNFGFSQFVVLIPFFAFQHFPFLIQRVSNEAGAPPAHEMQLEGLDASERKVGHKQLTKGCFMVRKLYQPGTPNNQLKMDVW